MPDGADVEGLRVAARGCRGCELWEPATQVVFSAGNPAAPLALVGEQPGDAEDRQGIPFVGPAGTLLQRALADAGVAVAHVYVTNAVKHFRFTERGKRRIHATPRCRHIKACRPWLEAELRLVDPALIVCLGATAAKALLGPASGSPSSAARSWTWTTPDRRTAGDGHRAPVRRCCGRWTTNETPRTPAWWRTCRPPPGRSSPDGRIHAPKLDRPRVACCHLAPNHDHV